MERRTFLAMIAGAMVAAPLAAEAQPAGKVYRIGMLETRSAVLNAANIDAFRRGLQDLGYKDGRNIEIVYRSSDGRDERFPDLASELVRLKVDLILTRGTPAALAAKSASRTIPVVMAASGAPVESGLVASLARPGGSLTGISLMQFELIGKRLEVLKEAVPGLTRVALLANTGHPGVQEELARSQAAAQRLGFTVQWGVLPRCSSGTAARRSAPTRPRCRTGY